MMVNEIPCQIDDKLSEIADYIAAAIEFAHWLIGEDKQEHLKQESVPFQIDFSFIFSSVKNNSDNKISTDDGEDDVDTSSDDDDDDDEDEKETDDFFDHFGSIELKLEQAQVNHISQDRDRDEENKEDQLLSTTELLKNHFVLFKREVKKEHEQKGYKTYPKDHRFVVLIDRRKPNKNGDGASYLKVNDDIHMFEPPEGTNELPSNPTSLALFDLSARVLIPGKDGTGQDIEYVTKTRMAPKSALDPCMGSLLTLSLHCFSQDEMRAYLFINGQSVRFFNQDIINLLPKYFSDNQENKRFINSDHAKELIESTKGKLNDTQFEKFYQLYKSKN